MARQRWTAERWRELLEQQRQGAQSVPAFCAEHGLKPSTFFAWRRRLRDQAKPDGGAFIELTDFGELSSSYNIAPTQPVPIVVVPKAAAERHMKLVRWGLLPSWSKDANSGIINARAETVAEKPSFLHAFRRRRCLIPANGFYEWQTVDGRKQPFNLESSDTVRKVKDMLAEKTGIYAEMIRLIYHGSPMVDDKTLAEHNVVAGNVIHMIMQMRG